MALAEAGPREIEAGPPDFRFLYPDDMPVMEKVKVIARKIYQAGAVSTHVAIGRQVAKLEESGYGKLPVRIAKTRYSFPADTRSRCARRGSAPEPGSWW